MATHKTIIITPIQGKRPISRAFLTLGNDQNIFKAESLESTRKRQRLTHLTPDERMLRRKLKNRVAAQTARDRKKERMQELEEALAELETENKRLQTENCVLKQATGDLSAENVVLKEQLGMDCEDAPAGRCNPPESAAGTGSLPPPEQPTIPILSPNSAESDLIGLLQQIIEGNSEDNSIEIPDTTSHTTQSHTTMVGPSTAELESIKELIQFDHEYHKSQPLVLIQQAPRPKQQTPRPLAAKSPVPMMSIIAPVVKAPYQTTTVTVSVTPMIEEASSPVSDLALSGDEDLVSYMESNMDSLIDLDDLLFEDKSDTSLNSQDKSMCNTKEFIPDNDMFKNSLLESNDDQIVSTAVYATIESPHSRDSTSSQDISNYSDISSPFSLDNNMDTWEESFTELFPSLV